MKGYIYKFQENDEVYIGRTINIKARKNDHKNDTTSSAYNISQNGAYTIILEYDGFQSTEELEIIEKMFIRDYRITHKCLNRLPKNDIRDFSITERIANIYSDYKLN